MYLYNMRNILLTMTLCLGILSCTTNNTTNNCTCQCGMGRCSSPSDTMCVKTESDSVIVNTEVKEGEQ